MFNSPYKKYLQNNWIIHKFYLKNIFSTETKGGKTLENSKMYVNKFKIYDCFDNNNCVVCHKM